MKKKSIALLLGLLLIMLLAGGCGKQADPEPEKPHLGIKVLTTRSTYDMCGNILFYSQVEFDEMGREKTLHFSGAGDSEGSKTEHTYDEAGHKILTEGFRPDGSMDYKRTFEYSEDGKLRKEVYSGFIGPFEDLRETVFHCITSEYDKKGQLTRALEYEDAECTALRYDTRYTYSDTGKVLTELKSKPDGSVVHYNEYFYDEHDFLISSTQDIVSIGSTYRSEYKNREDGKPLEIHIFRNGEKESISVNDYDDEGNLVGVTDMSPAGTVQYYEDYTWEEI